MPTIAHIALANAAAAALLAVPAWAVGRWGRRPALAHGLWLLVLLKLITPPLFLLPLPWLPPEDQPAEARAAADGSDFVWVRGTLVVPPRNDSPPAPQTMLIQLNDGLAVEFILPETAVVEPAGDDVLAAVPVEELPPELRPRPVAAIDPLAVLAAWTPAVLVGAWAVGAVVWFGWVGAQVLRFHRLLRHARPAPPDLQALAEGLAARLGMTYCPPVLVVPGAVPPLVWAAAGRPTVYFPSGLIDRLDPVERAALVAHELAHVCRRDHWVRWVELAAGGLFWWYPLVWYARGQMQATEEESCDAWVVGELPPRAYARALLTTLDFLAENRPTLPALASGVGNVPTLKRRLTMIMAAATPKRMSGPARLAWLAGALVLLPLVPTLARAIRPPAEPESREVEVVATTPAVEPWMLVPWVVPVEPRPELSPVPAVMPGTRETSFRLVAWSPDSRLLATITKDHQVEVRDVRDPESVIRMTGHGDRVNALAFSPDGQTLATGSSDRTVRLWDVATGVERAIFEGHTGWVHAVAFSPDGRSLASGGYDRTVRLWDVASGRSRGVLTGHGGAVRALAFSADGGALASGSADRTVLLWDANTGKERKRLRGHPSAIRALAFASDDRALVGACESGAVRVWDLSTGEPRESFRAELDEVAAVACSSRGRYVAAASPAGIVHLYDAFAARRVEAVRGRPDTVHSLAFAPDGRSLAAVGPARGVWLWNEAPLRVTVTPVEVHLMAPGDLGLPMSVLRARVALPPAEMPQPLPVVRPLMLKRDGRSSGD